jgi:exosome complex RNA-binding protein Csl4
MGVNANGLLGGYGSPWDPLTEGVSVGLITLYCSRCERGVYVTKEDTPICPVCSGPLVSAISTEEESSP